MDKIDLLHRLFTQGWSNRKINRSMGIHRDTISSYKKEWEVIKKSQSAREHKFPTPNHSQNTSFEPNQNGPLKCPPSEVAYFEVPTDPTSNSVTKSKSKAHKYKRQILEKLKMGQSARSIYQDIYQE